MYKLKNKVYSEAGFLLMKEGWQGYSHIGELADFTERKISLRNIEIKDDNFVYYSGILLISPKNADYAKLKSDMVKRRYSNDDLIAIILNKDDSEEDALAYLKMQEWREWSSQVARAIIEKRNNA